MVPSLDGHPGPLSRDSGLGFAREDRFLAGGEWVKGRGSRKEGDLGPVCETRAWWSILSMMRFRSPTPIKAALIVSDDAGLRQGLAARFEASGMEVMECPGPHRPDFSCVGLEGRSCALLNGADLVVVDLHPEPGGVIDTTRRAELLGHYTQEGRQVVALVDADSTNIQPLANGVVVAGRLDEPEELLDTVRELLVRSRGETSA
jgi:hypothetical protein